MAPVVVLTRLVLALGLVASTGIVPGSAETLPQGPYRGRVVEAGSGQPVAGAGVFIVWAAADETGAATSFAYREAQTDAQGEFTIDSTAIEQSPPPHPLPPQLWVYKPGYQLYPDRDVRPRGAAAAPLTQPGAKIQLIGARTDAERTEALNDFVAVINRYAPSGGPILLGLIQDEVERLRTVKPEASAAAPSLPAHPGAPGPCEVDPKSPPPLPTPNPPRVPAPGTYNPFEGRRAPYYGTVVDAESGTPLSDAVVVAVWTRRIVSPFHAHSATYDACDVVTDKDGEFILDGRVVEEQRISGLEPPTFSVFLPSYSAWGIIRRRVPPSLSSVRGDVEAFHGVTIGLTRLHGREERLEVVSSLPAPTSDIPLEKVPHLRRAVDRERLDLKRP